jgi:hypothetical protein
MFLILIGSKYNLSRSDPLEGRNKYAYNLLRGAGIMKKREKKRKKNTVPEETNYAQIFINSSERQYDTSWKAEGAS